MSNNRRNAFSVPPADNPYLPSKKVPERGSRLTASVPEATAQLAAHLAHNPVFTNLMEEMAAEAWQKFQGSAPGLTGELARSEAHFELRALSTIRERIDAVGAETALYSPGGELTDEAERGH